MTEKNEPQLAPEPEEHYWLSIADLMTGLMIVFLFVSLTYMANAAKAKEKVTGVVEGWNEGKQKLYHSLDSAFAGDLPKWNAEIDSVSISVRFNEPDVLFSPGSAEVKNRFRAILNDFFPRYTTIVRAHAAIVDEIRVEGHTSSEGPIANPYYNPYYYNMGLSQDRTRAVLVYCLESTGLTERDKNWVRDRLTANGLSSSKLIRGKNGGEDRNRSRRVEFRVRTNVEDRVAQILESAK